MQHSTEYLLCCALTMLDEARKEQSKSRRKDKWLTNNQSLEVIRQRVVEIKKAEQA